MAVKETKNSTPIDLSRKKSSKIGDNMNVSVSPITASHGQVLDTVVESEFDESFDLLKTGEVKSTLQAKTSTVTSTTHSKNEGRLNRHDIDKDSSTENNVNGVEVQDTNTTKSLDYKNESAISIASTMCEDILHNQNIQLSGESTLIEPDADNQTVVDKMANSDDSTVTLTKIECKNSDLSVTVTPSSSSLASNISEKDRQPNKAFFPDSEDLKEMSMQTTNDIDSVTNKEDTEWPTNLDTVPQAEDVKINQQTALPMSKQPIAQKIDKKPEPEIVVETLKEHHLNAEITEPIAKPMSPATEIVEKSKDLDTSQISEKSASILQANPEAKIDDNEIISMRKDDVTNKSEVGALITVPDKMKPLVDYDDTFTDVTQATVEDSANEDAHEDSDSELTQEFISLSEIPTSQLDTSIPSEFESDSNKDEAVEKSEENKVKGNVVGEKKKKKRLGNTRIVKKVKVKRKEITDDNKEIHDKEITDHDETRDELEAEQTLKGEKSAVKKKENEVPNLDGLWPKRKK